MVTAEQMGSAESQGRAQVIARQLVRSEIDAAYWAGRRDSLEDRHSGLLALAIGIVIGATTVGLVAWSVIA